MSTDREQQTLTSRDGTRLNAVVWAPERHLERTLVITHGLAEHMGRYEHVAEAFVEAGWRVIGLELRGHGDSDGKRGHVDAWSRYVEDLQAAIAFADGPVWILGHSMGGLIAISTVCRACFSARATIASQELFIVPKGPPPKVEAPKFHW